MNKLYLFVSHFDGYEPIHSITDCRKQIYKTKEEAIKRFELERMDFGVVFEIDTDDFSITLVGRF